MGDGSHFPSGLLLIDGLVPPVPASPPYNTRAESQLEPSDSSLASQPCITGQLRPLPSAPSHHQRATPDWFSLGGSLKNFDY